MASYSMQLRDYIEAQSQYIPNLKTRQKIEIARKQLFDFDYEIFDEAYRGVFETHFIRNFYMREIGFETEELFKFQLETWMIINFPYFNKLFESELIKYDPLINSELNSNYNKKNDRKTNNVLDVTHSSKADVAMTKDSKSKEDNFDRQLESNNPDSRLAITATDGTGVINYASSINENNANNVLDVNDKGTTKESSSEIKNDTLDGKINEIEDFVNYRVGKIGDVSYPKLIKEYREGFLRIEKTIFEEMQQLFMLVY